MVRNQIASFILGYAFVHNLNFRSPNGKWEPIFNIQISRSFQQLKNGLIWTPLVILTFIPKV
jgi:hypothetical protein